MYSTFFRSWVLNRVLERRIGLIVLRRHGVLYCMIYQVRIIACPFPCLVSDKREFSIAQEPCHHVKGRTRNSADLPK